MGLLDWLFGTEKKKRDNRKRVFISFSVKDRQYRDWLVKQAELNRSPFEFVDRSVKRPWNETEWKSRCRSRIKNCDCLIILLSKNTWHSSGVRWEIKCAHEERIRVIGMHIKKWDKGAIPSELRGCNIIEWSWNNLKDALK